MSAVSDQTRATPSWRRILPLLVALLLFRLAYGLASDFWTEDERQTYLIGLRSYARAQWPYFGPDVVWTQSRIPGGMQGWLVRLALEALPIPEAPFLLLNVLSFGALGFFAWYWSARLPELPAWFVWTWTLTAPWTLNFSTHVVNTSYITFGSVLFFVGFFEAVPALSGRLLPRPLAYGLMGFATAYLAQIHMSWVLLPLYVGTAVVLGLVREGRPMACAAALIAGAAVSGSLLIPTFLRYGLAATGGTQRNVSFEVVDPWTLVTILTRYFSFASFEVNRFLGLSTARRLVLLNDHWWLVPVTLFVAVIGLVQPLYWLACLFHAGRWPHWKALRILTVATPAAVYLLYFFSVKEPLAHAFYVTFPIVMAYSFHCWTWLLAHPSGAAFTKAFLAAGILFHAGLALARAPERSLYRDRPLVAAAIERREDRWLGERRISPGLPADEFTSNEPGPWHSAHARQDITVVEAAWSRAVFGRVSVFRLVLENTGDRAAFGDIRFATRYVDAAGQPINLRQGVIKEILQPGERRSWPRLVDGMAHPRAVAAELVIVGGEPYMPRSGAP